MTQTHTVTGGYCDRDGRFWLSLRGQPRAVQADQALPEGTSVRIDPASGKAVRANPVTGA